jgi:hypothetical protein
MSLLGWFQDALWPVRTWLSLGISQSVPVVRRLPVPQVRHPDELLPLLQEMHAKYVADPLGGLIDFSYDPMIVWWYLQAKRTGELAGLDCDDLIYLLWASLMSIATDIALVVLVDQFGGKYSHAVLVFTWAGQRWVMDYTGRHSLTGTTPSRVYAPLIPGARFETERWYPVYPFPDPRSTA